MKFIQKNVEYYALMVSLTSFVVSVAVNFVVFMLQRRKISLLTEVDHSRIYQSVYPSAKEALGYNKKNVSSRLDIPTKYSGFKISQTILINRSKYPIMIRGLEFTNKEIKEENGFSPLTKFDVQFLNLRKDVPETVTLLSGVVLPELNYVFHDIDLFKNDTIVLQPYESQVLTFAIPKEVNSFKITAYTTIKRFYLFQLFYKVLNIFNRSKKEVTFKTYSTTVKKKDNN